MSLTSKFCGPVPILVLDSFLSQTMEASKLCPHDVVLPHPSWAQSSSLCSVPLHNRFVSHMTPIPAPNAEEAGAEIAPVVLQEDGILQLLFYHPHSILQQVQAGKSTDYFMWQIFCDTKIFHGGNVC